MNRFFNLFVWVMVFSVFSLSGMAQEKTDSGNTDLVDQLNTQIKENWSKGYEDLFPARTKIDKLEITDEGILVRFSRTFGDIPIRPNTQSQLESFFQPLLPENLYQKPLLFFVQDTPIQDLIPRSFKKQLASKIQPPSSLVQCMDLPGPAPNAGLQGRHLTLGASHGWMYDTQKSFRWEWQRARLFNTVEDMHTMGYTLGYLIPMLERAGAVVFHAKERDWQTHEVVLDNDRRRNDQGSVSHQGNWRRRKDEPGFRGGMDPYPDAFNPHLAGDVHTKKTSDRPYAKFEWIPNIPETGEYGIYVSYHATPDRAPDARYTVYHLGGQTTFKVNQRIGGNTWIWLGRFKFKEGVHPREGRVELSNLSDEPGTTVCADAVKFGGGMGNVLREGETSGYPRYLEASRYWLQYAGADPDLTYKMGFNTGYEGPDYTDDFSCRAEWANLLNGAPNGPNKDRNHPGLGVPIDLFFSFHTDAGISDGIIGTLMIYYSKDQDGNLTFPDGRSRLLNRDLGDLIQTQVVDDVRSLYTSTWERRRLADSNYSESRRGNVPSCLVELMSHQNFNDMKYGLDPRFKFDVCRAMYKGMLRFIAEENGFEPIVEPLPPTHLAIQKTGPGQVILSWKPQEDPLEPTADPDGYIIYERIDDGGFNNGTYTGSEEITISNLQPGTIYSFQIEAVNRGGRSFPSETLAVEVGNETSKKALIVSGFDRLSGASAIQVPGHQGFDSEDRGVGRDYYWGRTGFQYDFDPKSMFVSNDAPGWGATSGEIEDKMELGNSFDYVARHGRAFVENGWSFDSVSNEVVESGKINLKDYDLVDWILGEQRTVNPPAGFIEAGTPDKMISMFKTFTEPMQAQLIKYATDGGALFVSGAYVGTDLAENAEKDSPDLWFLKNILHVDWVTNQGSKTNDLFMQKDGLFDGMKDLHFAIGLGEDGVYGVELPDALDPVKDSGGKTVLRYNDRRFSAGVIYEDESSGAKTFVMGFPFETLVGQEQRTEFLSRVLQFLAP